MKPLACACAEMLVIGKGKVVIYRIKKSALYIIKMVDGGNTNSMLLFYSLPFRMNIKLVILLDIAKSQ